MDRQEAIQIIKKNWPNGRHMLSEALEFLIPELKESEDEKIRKGIIKYPEQTQFVEEHHQLDNAIVRDYITWLEKQGEQKPADNVDVLMSLDEAIEHCKEKSCGNNACALEHKQLEKWLTELKELKEQKPVWSEEDEKMCQETIDWFEKKCFPYALESQNPARESITWLKSLKKRMKGK